jgi:hypothetical protein
MSQTSCLCSTPLYCPYYSTLVQVFKSHAGIGSDTNTATVSAAHGTTTKSSGAGVHCRRSPHSHRNVIVCWKRIRPIYNLRPSVSPSGSLQRLQVSCRRGRCIVSPYWPQHGHMFNNSRNRRTSAIRRGTSVRAWAMNSALQRISSTLISHRHVRQIGRLTFISSVQSSDTFKR